MHLSANGWVAAGLVRTRQIFLQSPIADEMGPEIEDLLQWTLEIMNDVVQHQVGKLKIRRCLGLLILGGFRRRHRA